MNYKIMNVWEWASPGGCSSGCCFFIAQLPHYTQHATNLTQCHLRSVVGQMRARGPSGPSVSEKGHVIATMPPPKELNAAAAITGCKLEEQQKQRYRIMLREIGIWRPFLWINQLITNLSPSYWIQTKNTIN